jgi:hypothetical protein
VPDLSTEPESSEEQIGSDVVNEAEPSTEVKQAA